MKTRSIAFAAVVMTLFGCAKKELPVLPAVLTPLPPVAEIESVIFIVGDAGHVTWEQSPMVRSMAREVELWSERLARDSSVAVLFLGDNVYPAGMHLPTEREWPDDSTHLEAQIMILGGPRARAHKSFGVFIAGNHDWGHKYGAGGEQRIQNQEKFIDRRRNRGIHVRFLPPDATPGPGIVDVRSHLRMLLIDTAWWLLSADGEEKQRMMRRLQDGITTAGQRNVLIGAHHPVRSAGAHGGLSPFWTTVGVKWLLTKSGASLQDLNSLPYRDLITRLAAVFRLTGAPLVFAGGHDHSLQVLRGLNREEPSFILVSGSGSKLSRVGHAEGMLYRSLEPGYMMLVTKKDGSTDLFVHSAPESFLACDTGPPEFWEQCVNAGAEAFRVTFGMTLK